MRRCAAEFADFVGANLAGADPSRQLAGADFTGANLAGADFTGADVQGAHFARWPGANSNWAGLKRGDLRMHRPAPHSDKAAYKTEEPALRKALLLVRFNPLARRSFPMLILIASAEHGQG